MDRVQQALGVLGAVMLVAGAAITAVGPAELGLVGGGTDGGAATTTDTPESGTASVGPAAGASATDARNETDDGESGDDGASSPSAAG